MMGQNKQTNPQETENFHRKPSNNQRTYIRQVSRNAGYKNLQIDIWKYQNARYKEMGGG